MTMPFHKYRPYPPVELADRTWPDTRITNAPIWTSVDLRDGNQALDPPMDVKRKRRMFDLLLDVGFNEIEIGFPAASQVEFEFARTLEREDLIPDGVSVMMLTQARSALIRRTFDSLDGLPRAIVHLYNSTSTTQRRVVFGLGRDGIRDLAVEGAKLCRELAEQRPDQDIRFEYTPESYTATEPEFAVEICEAVMDVFEPTPDRKLILNLPATVELSTPNLYADMIEAFCRNISRRDSLTISLHPHNDRGTAVAATELALMAGADRVEGTLFGNGERTGNVDIITLALNLMAQGVDPGLNLSKLEEVRKEAEYCNRLPVHERHPYAGELIFTAFSGSHQDAIHKGMQAMSTEPGAVWDVPYLPIDPKDIGTKYDDAVRVNSQSGKGGVAYLMRAEHDLVLPRLLQIEFTRMVQREVEETGEEITAERLIKLFRSEYNSSKVRVVTHEVSADDTRHVSVVRASLQYLDRAAFPIHGSGNGTIAAFTEGIEQVLGLKIRVRDYSQQTLSDGTDAKAMSYVKLSIADDMAWGVGEDTDTAKANFDAILSAVSRIPHALERFAVRTSDDQVALTPAATGVHPRAAAGYAVVRPQTLVGRVHRERNRSRADRGHGDGRCPGRRADPDCWQRGRDDRRVRGCAPAALPGEHRRPRLRPADPAAGHRGVGDLHHDAEGLRQRLSRCGRAPRHREGELRGDTRRGGTSGPRRQSHGARDARRAGEARRSIRPKKRGARDAVRGRVLPRPAELCLISTSFRSRPLGMPRTSRCERPSQTTSRRSPRCSARRLARRSAVSGSTRPRRRSATRRPSGRWASTSPPRRSSCGTRSS
jgi:2-isopropylmalate synthase